MQKSFVAAPLSSSSVSPGPDVLSVAAATSGLSAAAGGSWVFCPGEVLHAGPGHSPAFCRWGSTSASRYWWLMLVPGFQRSTLLPTLRMSRLSLMTSPVGLGFFPSQQTGRFSVLCLVVSRYKSFQLASHFIGHFADHLLPAVGKGRKPLLGAEARLLPLGF